MGEKEVKSYFGYFQQGEYNTELNGLTYKQIEISIITNAEVLSQMWLIWKFCDEIIIFNKHYTTNEYVSALVRVRMI